MEIEALIVKTAPMLDKQALVGIYERHNLPLYRYAYRMLGDPALAEDCVSETFSRFLHVVRDGRIEIVNIRAYLYRMAHNWATDYYRRRPGGEVSLDADLTSEPDANPDHQFTQRQQAEIVRSALQNLPADQRQVIELRFLEEWSHVQVAEVLGKSVEATRALQHRALISLRRILLRDESESDPMPDSPETDRPF